MSISAPHSSESGTDFSSSQKLPLVLIAQPEVQHYRIPVFDLLAERARDRYRFEVWGQLENGKAYKGEARDYLHHTPYLRQSLFGVLTMKWPELLAHVERLRPDVVVVVANIRNRTSWQLPSVVRRISAACVGWDKAYGYSSFPQWARARLMSRMYRKFDQMIAYGNQAADAMVKVGVPRNRIYVANNTIDTRSIFEQDATFRAAAASLREREGLVDKKILLMICRLNPDKRPGDVLDAWPQLRELDPNLVLVIAGSGELADELKTRCVKIDPERTKFVGRLPAGEDYTWIAASDMTIQCGAIGLAINQSMAFGKATIVADEPGPDSEIVEHGVTGWRYPRGDLTKMVETVGAVLKNSSERERITNAAREQMRTKITIENMVEQIDRCVTDALKIAHARRNPQ
jgi:glycosyltransferase involved in cell wall biosynthesis